MGMRPQQLKDRLLPQVRAAAVALVQLHARHTGTTAHRLPRTPPDARSLLQYTVPRELFPPFISAVGYYRRDCSRGGLSCSIRQCCFNSHCHQRTGHGCYNVLAALIGWDRIDFCYPLPICSDDSRHPKFCQKASDRNAFYECCAHGRDALVSLPTPQPRRFWMPQAAARNVSSSGSEAAPASAVCVNIDDSAPFEWRLNVAPAVSQLRPPGFGDGTMHVYQFGVYGGKSVRQLHKALTPQQIFGFDRRD